MLYTYVSITYSYFQGILYSFYFINCMGVTVHTPLFREVFGMNMPKSRDIQAKIPLPQAIWNEFWLRYCERSEPMSLT